MKHSSLSVKLLATLLVVHLLLGHGVLSWAQGAPRGNEKGGARGKPPAGTQKSVKGGKPLVDQKEGVVSSSPAEEMLPGGQALSRAVVPDQYVLGPGDKLSINIWGEYNETYMVSITPDGKISLPTIGDLTMKGLTLTQAQALVGHEVRKYYRNVESGVSLTSLRVFEVRVLGGVINPGMYLATPVRRVSDVIERTGGIRVDGSQRTIQVLKDGKIRATADLYAFLTKGDESANPYVSDGDLIFVPPLNEWRVVAYVSEVSAGQTGALNENSIPYTVEIKEGDRLSTVINELGGISPWWDLDGAFIQRETKEPAGVMRISVDLHRLVTEKDETQNPEMKPGDQVYIPALIRRVIVTGAVKVPASYPYFPGRHVDAYIAQAGGMSLFADLDRSYIKRAEGAVDPYLGSAELNNGDTVVVMEKALKTYADYFALFGTVTGVVLSGVGLLSIFKK